MTTTIGIVGSREFEDYDGFLFLLGSDLVTLKLLLRVDRIVSGGQRGVDTLASILADESRCDFTEYAPSKFRPFTQAAHERNQMIVDDLAKCREEGHEVALIAMPGPRSKGTWDTVRRAKRAGIKVIIREVPE